MKARENAGYVVTKVDEDPAVLYEQHRKASCMRASHILERYESPDQDAVRILHGIVGEVNAHDPENDIATYLAYPSDKVVQIAGDGLTSADIAEKREMADGPAKGPAHAHQRAGRLDGHHPTTGRPDRLGQPR